jgi:hypothetical protein
MTSSTRDQIIVYAGGALLLLFILLSWVPTDCSVIRRAVIGCSSIPLSRQTPEQQEINRVPHQSITVPAVEVQANGEADRSKSRITFEYRIPTGSKATLNVSTSGGLVPLATITHPLLEKIDWHLLKSEAQSTSLYTRNENPASSIEDFLATSPTGLAADEPSVRYYNLKPGTYTRFEDLQTLDGTQSLLLSYLPPEPDGTWNWFQSQFDLSQYPLNSDQHIKLVIINERPADSSPLLLGEVHIDYRK